MPKVKWVLQQISYAFWQCKNFENLLRHDKVTESFKVGNSFETQCRVSELYFCRRQYESSCIGFNAVECDTVNYGGDFKKVRVNGGTENDSLKDSHKSLRYR